MAQQLVTVQGVDVPALGLGTWRMTGRDCQESVEAALQLGYRHIDTAQAYENEADVGAGIQAAGIATSELFVTTKINSSNHAPDRVRASTEESLRKLRVDAVDLLLIHHPSEFEILDQTLGAMVELQEQGLVHHLGVSNFSVDQLEQALDVASLFAIQIEYHPFRSQDDQLDAARKHDLLFQAYSPLARGGVEGDDTLAQIAAKRDATEAQVALRWLLDQEQVAAIPKASSVDHVRENWGALELRLDEDDHRRLDELTQREQKAKEVGD